MSRVRVDCFSISIDGFGAGPDQSIDNPLGVGGESLHDWIVATRNWRAMHGKEGGETGVDNDFAARGGKNVGAWIMGRYMFGPVRGPLPDESWRGWWGKRPPFRAPVFVLTHHARPPLEMEGGTTFHFVTEGTDAALDQARKAAGDKDVQIGGGASTIQQYLRRGLIDELHVAITPVVLGQGERLFEGVDLAALGYECVEFVGTPNATHMVLRRK
jgi:dihydrofolate reductase